MDLIQVESVQAFIGSYEDVLVSSVRMHPRGSAVDMQGTSVEHLGETCTHMHLRCGREPIAAAYWPGLARPR